MVGIVLEICINCPYCVQVPIKNKKLPNYDLGALGFDFELWWLRSTSRS